MEVADGDDGALAAGIVVAATMQLFVYAQETSKVGTNRVHIALDNSPEENAHLTLYTKACRAARRDPVSRLDVGLPLTKLLLRLTEHLLVQQFVSVEATFVIKHSVLSNYYIYTRYVIPGT